MNLTPIRSVVVVGSGNVAEAFVRALTRSPYELRQVFARNALRGAEVARLGGTEWCGDPAHLASADLYLIAVSDRAVAEVAAALLIPKDAVMAHTAGCVSVDTLPVADKAVIYPFQTFTQGREVDFLQIPLFIEAANPDLERRMKDFACGLSCVVLPANGPLRARIHLAGVFACNFANHMFAVGERMLGGIGLSYDLLRPMIAEMTAKALVATDPGDVQTGPAVRGDRTTQECHLALLEKDAELETIYKSISKHIWETSRKI